MKVLVCGSRHFNDYGLLEETLDGLLSVTEVIEGEAKGADILARRWATLRGIEVRRFPADWEKYGKAAGSIRNIQMLKEGKPDLVVAFMGPNSRGTKHMVTIAQKQGVETICIPVGTPVPDTLPKRTSEA